MLDAPAICYASEAEKRRQWPRETLPAIMQAARRAVASQPERAQLAGWMRDNAITTAESLHDVCRAGRYVPTPEPRRHCDPIQAVSATIRAGGDCDQWAAVVLAALWLLGFRALYLVTVGDTADPYRHAAVMLEAEGRQWWLDPKPDQTGVPFNVRSDTFPLVQHHRFSL